jgi:hypothetical protein
VIEHDIKRLAEGLKMSEPTKDSKGNPIADARWSPDAFGRLGNQAQPAPASTRPTGSTVLEALEKLHTHAVAILNDAIELEGELTGQPGSKDADDAVKAIGGIWDRLAAKIVMIERVFAQIDEAHAHAQASLK